jgi:hypothetical protein
MNLIDIYSEYCVDSNGWPTTDKGLFHDYLEAYYTEEFANPERVTSVLEIGVQNGGSLILWHEWFTNAKIVGIDIMDACLNNYKEASLGREFPRIEIIIADGYDKSVIDQHKDNSYDYIIEDVQSVEWFEELASHAKKFGYEKYRTFDFRENKLRSDDLIFELEK